MIILDYQKKNHKQFVHAVMAALIKGKVVAYPTDTSYGLAVDATNRAAIKKLYRIKERQQDKPIHVVVPSISYAKSIGRWDKAAEQIVKKFWPGPVTLVLELKAKGAGLKLLSAGTKTLGLRMPKNNIALDLARELGKPITATSANPSALKSGGFDSYSANDIVSQFKNKKFKPDIIINAGKLPKQKPSTIVKIVGSKITVLREGPVSEKQLKIALGKQY
jgi:L-threonylcarbamoyladenylate synthase